MKISSSQATETLSQNRTSCFPFHNKQIKQDILSSLGNLFPADSNGFVWLGIVFKYQEHIYFQKFANPQHKGSQVAEQGPSFLPVMN